jgi:hypothetical protein
MMTKECSADWLRLRLRFRWSAKTESYEEAADTLDGEERPIVLMVTSQVVVFHGIEHGFMHEGGQSKTSKS